MEETGQRIEIFAPCEAALALTKRMLFQPFDLAKWCLIGFAAFLAKLGEGGGFKFPTNWGHEDWHKVRSATSAATGGWTGLPGWAIPLLIVVVLIIAILTLVLIWIRSRGEFVFTDCVVHNRGAIVEPWKDFRREGDSLFCCRVLVGLAFVSALALAGTPIWLPWALRGTFPEGATVIVGMLLLASVMVIGGLGWAIASYFMVPIMYRRRCRAWAALRESVGLIVSEPWSVILFFLFSLVLALAVMMIACLLTCMTCCLAAIPYVGTVILLPIFVLRQAYLLLFVRQFGAEYDVWAGLGAGRAAGAGSRAVDAASLGPVTRPKASGDRSLGSGCFRGGRRAGVDLR
ncbi:MAG: hypothetical protein ABI946_03145 [Chthoniobacterales bacterium]